MRTRVTSSFVASLGLSSLVAFAIASSGGCGRLKPAAVPDSGAAGDTAGTSGAAGTGGGGTVGAAGNAGTTGGHVLVTVSGTAAPHPLNALVATPAGATDGGTADAATDAADAHVATDTASATDAATDVAADGATDTAADAATTEAGAPAATNADFSMLKVAIVDPTAVITNPNATPLASTTLDTSAANCTSAGCAFSLTGVDITNQTLGLVGTLEDKRTGDARLWVKTGTGMGTKAFVDAAKAAKAPIMDRRAFIVSRKLEAKLVTFVNGALGTTLAAGDLEARGFLIGHVLDKLSTATTPAVMAQGTNLDVIYPNATFTGKGTVTSASGIFLMVPKLVNGVAQPVVTSWMVNPPAGDTRAWEPHLAGTNPGNAYVLIMPANE
jgi:hypothetical protein